MLRTILGWSIACLPVTVMAVPSVLLVAHNSQMNLLNRIETAINNEPGVKPKVVRIEVEAFRQNLNIHNYCTECKLMVTLGLDATQEALKKQSSIPIVSVLIRKQWYDELITQYIEEHGSSPNLTALFLDHPFKRQLNLIECLVPPSRKKTKVGVLLGPSSEQFEDILHDQFKNYPFDLHVITVSNQSNAISALNTLLEDVDVILAVPDNAIYNSKTARGLLLSAYRKRVPVIGFSRAYVNNGAIGAIYSAPKQIANETAEYVMEFLQNKTLKRNGQFPDAFSVAINYQVARSMGFTIDTEATLHYSIQQQEGEHGQNGTCHLLIKQKTRNTKEK